MKSYKNYTIVTRLKPALQDFFNKIWLCIQEVFFLKGKSMMSPFPKMSTQETGSKILEKGFKKKT